MNVSRESVFAALFNLVATNSFVTKSRKFQTWDNLPADLQPAIFLREGDQRASQDYDFGLVKWTLRASIWIYCQHAPDEGTIPATNLNALIDAVDRVLLPSPGFSLQTLGGLVTHCFIDGAIVIDEGLAPLDTQSIAVIPVTIITGQ